MTEHDVHRDHATVSLPPVRKGRWLTLALTVVVFVSGLAVGSGLTFMYIENRRESYLAHPEDAPKRLADRLRKTLSLNDQQARRVQEIITQYWPIFQETRRNVYPAFKDMLDSLESEVAVALHGEQVRKWHDYVARIRQAWNPPITTAPADASDPSSPPKGG